MGWSNEILRNCYDSVTQRLNIIPRDELDIALGNVPYKVQITLCGKNENFSTVFRTIAPMGTRYVFPITDSVMSIVSTSSEDSQSGIGLKRIVVRGLDIDYKPINEVILLNGTTPVLTTKKFFRINEVNVEDSGISNTTQGTVTVKQDTNVLAQFDGTCNITTQAIFTVPADTTLAVGSIHISAGKDDEGAWSMYVINPINNMRISQTGSFFYQNAYTKNEKSFIIIPEKHDIEFACIKTGSGGTSRISAWINCVLAVKLPE